ncbi:MAG: hypothetical protein FD152_470 [Xanthobacteraceae bacterium]|nr:MAG: hypothetical protein FD152_470 [Xanthobacteraceae bacterium]
MAATVRRALRSGMLNSLVAISLLACPGLVASAHSSSGSMAFDRLDLRSPEAALRQFLSAYRRGDYVTAYWIMTPTSQSAFARHLARFEFNRIARLPASSAVLHAAEMMPSVNQMEQTDTSFYFAHAMAVAHRLGVMPLNLSGLPEDVSPTNVPRLGNRNQLTDGKVEFAVPLRAYRAPVVFRFVSTQGGRWRLEQILPPGGTVDSLPFGLPTD